MDFNDIRTTLQALIAIYDNANRLHTNAYDEAVTTPSAESVTPRARDPADHQPRVGPGDQREPAPGLVHHRRLTDLVEEAVLAEFDRITERGGVLGAMETGYQRGRIQDESMLYEQRKHDGSLPIIGVNTFLNPEGASEAGRRGRAGPRDRGGEGAPSSTGCAPSRPPTGAEAEAALRASRTPPSPGDNVFAVLMDAARVCSLGQITEAFFEVGGAYRRNV